MSDFIFSSKTKERGELSKEIRSIYKENIPWINEYHGEWGSLAVSRNLYNGFDPIENNKHILIMIGGPILTFTDNKFINGKDNSYGTKIIYNKFEKMKWDEDLSGPYVIFLINKKFKTIKIVTDIMSFIPVYISMKGDEKYIGTHIDSLAKISGNNVEIDLISITDLIINGYVTFPYTTYKDIRQLAPACIHEWNIGDDKYKYSYYWIPMEKIEYKNIKIAALDLKKYLKNFIDSVTEDMDNIGTFITGGEDSRLILSLLPKNKKCDSFIYLDRYNREGRIAKKASKIFNANFNIYYRSKTHYLDILPECSDFVGSCSQYVHSHTYKLYKESNLLDYKAVFGGFLSDCLIKAIDIKKYDMYDFILIQYVHTLFDKISNKSQKNMINIIDNEIINKINKRHMDYLKRIKEIRGKSAENWFRLWPMSMNEAMPYFYCNRRLFRIYEPFMSNEVVKFSASVPQKWKISRRLFNIIARDSLKPSKYLIHTEGWMPSLPWYFNIFISRFYKILFKLLKTFRIEKTNQGPWFDPKELFREDIWNKLVIRYTNNHTSMEEIFKSDIKNLLLYSELDYIQKITILQVLYFLNKNNGHI